MADTEKIQSAEGKKLEYLPLNLSLPEVTSQEMTVFLGHKEDELKE